MNGTRIHPGIGRDVRAGPGLARDQSNFDTGGFSNLLYDPQSVPVVVTEMIASCLPNARIP